MNFHIIIVIFSVLILGVFTINLVSAQVDPFIDIEFLQTGELNTVENQFHISNEITIREFFNGNIIRVSGQVIEGFETFLANGSPILGNPNAPVTLVEFGDYQCHFCNVFFHSTEDDILRNYIETGKVRMIFKDYNIIGPDSISASHGAHCANDQGLFWEYHDILYSN